MTDRTPKGDLERDLQDPECARLYQEAVRRTDKEAWLAMAHSCNYREDAGYHYMCDEGYAYRRCMYRWCPIWKRPG